MQFAKSRLFTAFFADPFKANAFSFVCCPPEQGSLYLIAGLFKLVIFSIPGLLYTQLEMHRVCALHISLIVVWILLRKSA